MKADLDLKLIKTLSLARFPEDGLRGKLIFKENPKEIDGRPNPTSSATTSYGTPTARRHRASASASLARRPT
jgi:hypothetical protein